MLLLILAIVIGLVAWALQLMEKAIEGQEFSLMLAGFLVASTAAAMMSVYFLMGDYMVFVTQAAHASDRVAVSQADETTSIPSWLVEAEWKSLP
ncbi:MAG: hypothetical protein HC873_01110 [Leptolyngbyaceae cyanobacterium SL_1_1]|nr:hypothetical protein [Leptolyngbyaceae cyanobacterium RM1_1_2]NJO08467.1 hypothetical protein [Leptolyngbyaceae cyanobacterium SL_1_1]